ncbi:hypothetical protein [Natrononativus amylolyticus]|uniref:hypothetical protein n=1 Tax=Natrononativus amylolyticus TaxID=2963434 RepID=UPI0020CEE028|nr:hypothetical protein [Natrononativus amylolyticus]
MSSITIDPPVTEGTTLRCAVRSTPDLERFVGDEFIADYDVPIDDVPDGVLSIPVLAQVCPVAWANGADVYVDSVDATFARALEDVKASLLSMYDFLEGGTLYSRRTPDLAGAVGRPDAGGTDSALLFTGGVDSTCSYVAHRETEPMLVSIRGWTITPEPYDDEKWGDLRTRVSTFADERGLETAFLESNMLSFLDHPMLLAHYSRYVDGGWYSSVGHGLGLLGLCAPLTYVRGIDDLYVAATHWEGIDLEWGSRPDIDDFVRWGSTRCHHDAYELTRQERIDLIADYVREEAPNLQLQTCNARMDGNCGVCEKCYRTAVGLRLAGLEPPAHGYPFTDEDYHDLRQSFERGRWVLGYDELYMWEDIRERVAETEPQSPAERTFFAWLETADLEDLVDGSGPPLSHRVLRTGARHTPNAVYNTLYPAWARTKSELKRVRQ